jgi:hypothetical protein
LYSPHPQLGGGEEALAELRKKTGRTLDQWAALARKEGPRTGRELEKWLRDAHGLGRQEMWLILRRLRGYDEGPEKLVEALFAGKQGLLPLYHQVLKAGLALGPDVKACPCKTMVPLYRETVFAELRPVTRTRLELRLALDGEPFTDTLISTGGKEKGERLTHRIDIVCREDIGPELLACLKRAYEVGGHRRKAGPRPAPAAPLDLLSAIDAAGLRGVWDGLAPSHRREHVLAVCEARKPETRARRIGKCVESLRSPTGVK